MFTCAVNSRSQHICDHWILLFYFYQIADKTYEFKNAHKRSLQSAKYLVTKKGNGKKVQYLPPTFSGVEVYSNSTT